MSIISSTRNLKKNNKRIRFCFTRLNMYRRVKNAKRVIENYILVRRYIIV